MYKCNNFAKEKKDRGFTLIELLVVISIIAFLSSVVFVTLTSTRIKARDTQRLQNARQLAIALEQYEATFNTYRISNAGLNDSGFGFVAKKGGGGYNNSILDSLNSAGLYSSADLSDPIFGLNNYYLGVCTSTNSYNIFVKLEQEEYNAATSSIISACGGYEAASLGFNFIAATAGGSTAGGSAESGSSGFVGSSDNIVDLAGVIYGTVTGEDGKIWLDRNLGASRVALFATDTAAYGDLYQWGRGRDGHQIRTSLTTTGSSTLDWPGSNFIRINPSVLPNDWRTIQQSYYWTGVNGGPNNPCPSGFRVPTISELYGLAAAIPTFGSGACNASSQCVNVAFNSKLKLAVGGYRFSDSAGFNFVGIRGFYWSSDVRPNPAYVSGMYYSPTGVASSNFDQWRANGFSVRCIKE